MGVSLLLNGICMGFAGAAVGLTQIAGLSPLAICFMAAACMNRRSVPAAYIGLICGLAVKAPQTEFVRYGVIMLGITVLLCSRYFDTLGRSVYVMALCAGVVTFGVDMAVYLFTDSSLLFYEVIIEALMVIAVSIIYGKALYVIFNDGFSLISDNSAAISVIVLLGSIVYGLPYEIGDFVIAETFAIFTIMCGLYIFGLGIGLAWASVCGMLMSVSFENDIYLTAWLPIFLMSYALLSLLHGRRLVFAVLFAVLYLICGAFFYEQMLAESGIKALLSGLILFVFLPHSMIMQLTGRLNKGALNENSPEWGRLMVNRISDMANAFKRIDYTMTLSPETGIGFRDVGGIIENFTSRLEQSVPLKKTIEARILDELAAYDIEVKNLALLKNEGEFYEIYLNLRIRRGRLVAAEVVRKIVEKQLNIPLYVSEESRNIVGRSYEIIALKQKPQFKCITAVKQISRYMDELSGDNYYVGDIRNGQMLVMLADGMGSGSKASEDSRALIDAMEELLTVGFDKELSIKIVNAYLSRRNKGESFATLDMLLVDLYTGYGRIYKQGAATTYVKRGEWLEMIKSTSLPMGVIEGALCEKCGKKLYNNDIIVMLSDGMTESLVVENKEDFMRDFLMGLESDSPEDIANELTECVVRQSGSRLRDDAMVIVLKLVKCL